MKKFYIIAVALFIACLQSVHSQITTNELPVSVQRGVGVLIKEGTKGTVDLPVPDIKKLLHEDSLYQEKHPNGLQRTSVAIPLSIDLNKDGIWTSD